MSDFYQEYTAADDDIDMTAICNKYGKDPKKARQALNTAMKMDMMSSNTSREVFHQRIVEQLKKKGL